MYVRKSVLSLCRHLAGLPKEAVIELYHDIEVNCSYIGKTFLFYLYQKLFLSLHKCIYTINVFIIKIDVWVHFFQGIPEMEWDGADPFAYRPPPERREVVWLADIHDGDELVLVFLLVVPFCPVSVLLFLFSI